MMSLRGFSRLHQRKIMRCTAFRRNTPLTICLPSIRRQHASVKKWLFTSKIPTPGQDYHHRHLSSCRVPWVLRHICRINGPSAFVLRSHGPSCKKGSSLNHRGPGPIDTYGIDSPQTRFTIKGLGDPSAPSSQRSF